MSSDPETELISAGHRVAGRVVAVPPVAAIARRAARRRNRRRAGAAAAALSVVGLGTALSRLDTGGEPSLVAGAVGPATTAPSASDTGPTQPPAPAGTDVAQLVVSRSQDGTVVLEVEVVEGPGAADRAADAAAWSEETTTVDGVTVWSRRDGDRLVVAAAPSPERYVEASGPPEQRARLEELVVDSGSWTIPDSGAPDSTAPDPTAPDSTAPDSTAPDPTAPDHPYDDGWDDQFDEFEQWGFGGLPDLFGWKLPTEPSDPGEVPHRDLYGAPGILGPIEEMLRGICVDVDVWGWPGEWEQSPQVAPGPLGGPADLERQLEELWRLLAPGMEDPRGWPGTAGAVHRDDPDAANGQDEEPSDPSEPSEPSTTVPGDPGQEHWRHYGGLGDCTGEIPASTTTEPGAPDTSTTTAPTTTSTIDEEATPGPASHSTTSMVLKRT